MCSNDRNNQTADLFLLSSHSEHLPRGPCSFVVPKSCLKQTNDQFVELNHSREKRADCPAFVPERSAPRRICAYYPFEEAFFPTKGARTDKPLLSASSGTAGPTFVWCLRIGRGFHGNGTEHLSPPGCSPRGGSWWPWRAAQSPGHRWLLASCIRNTVGDQLRGGRQARSI